MKETTIIDHLLTNIPTTNREASVGDVVKLVRSKQNWDSINYLYVLNEKKELIGVVSIKELLRHEDKTQIGQVMVSKPVGIISTAKQERASIVAIEKNIKNVPVFKPGTREFLGVIGPDTILKILHEENVEDFLKFSGIVKDHPTVNFFKAPVGQLVKARLPWLMVGLAGSMIGAAMVGLFAHTLEAEIALAFFIPVIVYITNSISTQTQALLLRLLAQQKVEAGSFFRKELAVSIFLGLFSALTIVVFSWLWLQSLTVAITVGLAIIIGTMVGVAIAVAIPSLLYAAKKDPALGTGPFATALQDVASLVIYFLIASAIIL